MLIVGLWADAHSKGILSMESNGSIVYVLVLICANHGLVLHFEPLPAHMHTPQMSNTTFVVHTTLIATCRRETW
jgi:hypothetical protein